MDFSYGISKFPIRCLRQQTVGSPRNPTARVLYLDVPASAATLGASVTWWFGDMSTSHAFTNSHVAAETLRSPLEVHLEVCLSGSDRSYPFVKGPD